MSPPEPAPPPGSIVYEVRHKDEHHALGAAEQLVIVVWRVETRLAAVQRVSQLIDERAREEAELGLLQIVEAQAKPPDSEVRGAIASMLREHKAHLVCSAVVFEGEGFRAATVRGIVTAINLVSKPSFPHEIFATPAAAVRWTAARLAVRDPGWPEHARSAVEGLRGAIGKI